MAQNVIINGVTYQNVPEVDIPKSGGGTAKFYDTASANVAAGDLLTGKTAFGATGSVSGSMANNGSTSGTIGTKAGTVTMDVTKAVQDIKAGKIEYRLDKSNIVHVPIGKASFTEEKLTENFNALMDAIVKARPSTVKGAYLKSVTLASTMGPGVKVNPLKVM